VVSEESVTLLHDQLRDETPTPETMQLFKAVWGKSSPELRQDLLASIGLPTERETNAWRDDELLHARLLRQWEWLAGVESTLPEPWASAYRRLVREFGEADAEARRYTTTGYVGEISPLDTEALARFGPDGLAEWLKSWQPPSNRWAAPTPNGLGASIREIVSENPAEWIAALPELVQRLRYPSYVRGVVAGVKEALERQDAAAIDWTRVLAALNLVSTDPWPVHAQTADPFDADRDWSETQREATRLLQSALKRNAPFDEDQLELIWAILTRLLTKGRNAPSTIVEERPDLMMLAINKDSTVALQTMFELALNASRREMVGRWGERLAAVVREQLEVGGTESRLSGVIAAGLLPQFLHVSGQAAVDLITTLFGEPRPEEISIETLETMLKYSRPITNDLLVIFLPYLEVYFRVVPSAEGEAERSAVRWFLIAYIRGIHGLESPSQLLDVLEEPSRLSEAAEFYGRVLRESEAPVELADALRFWDAFLEKDPPPTAYVGFGWWSEGNAVPDSEWLERIVVTLRRSSGLIDWGHEVVDRLSRLSEFAPAWEALTLLVKGAPERWTVAYWAARLLRLFEDTEGSPEPISSARTELAEALLDREFLDFRRFIASVDQ